MKYKFYKEQIEPKDLRAMAKIVGRDLESKKSPNNYNYDLFSKTRDKVAGMFSEIGIDHIMNKDVVEVTAMGRYHNFKRMEIFDLDMAMEKGDYYLYPYNLVIENEIRTKYLLQTEADDDFKDMVEELFIHLKKYLKKEDLEKIDRALNKAKERVYKQTIKFLDPYQGLEEGNYRELTKEEMEQNLIVSDHSVYIDERTERFDLLALKELLLIFRGDKNVDKYSIGMGFFNKFLPELKDEGIDGIIMHIKEGQIENLKVESFKGKINFNYSPLKASLFTHQAFLSDYEEKERKLGEKVVKYTKFSNFREIQDNEFFIVSVDGAVANQEDINLIGYSGTSYNNKIEKAGETFLIDNEKMVRLYFTPYNYLNFPLVHNHGSVIFGSNDQTYHSVSELPNEKISESMIGKLQKMWNSRSDVFEVNEGYVPAVISLMFKEKNEDPVDFFKKRDNVNSVIKGLSEESTVSRVIALNEFFGMNNTYNEKVTKEFVTKYTLDNHPLSKMFNLKHYVENNDLAGLQDTWMLKQCKELFIKDSLQGLKLIEDDEK
jgi:hypothetical protein